MGLDVAEVKLYGPVDVQINGVTVGHTTMEGVTVKRTPKVAEAKVGKFGDTPVASWQDGETIEVDFTLAQSNFGMLATALPSATLVTAVGGAQKMTFGKIAGSPLTAVSLKLVPFVAANTPTYDLTIPKAVSVGDFNVDYIGEKFNGFKCKFKGHINEGQSDGNLLWTLGDTSITADLVAPTVSSVLPADAEPAAPVSTNVVWTLSKDIDPNTIIGANVKLFKDPTGSGATGLEVAGAISLVNAGAGTQITFNPTSNLSAATKYIAVLEGIKDLAGNLLASGFYATEFTTAP